jgi:ribosomal protein S18 acetylase RimI-like enzyme
VLSLDPAIPIDEELLWPLHRAAYRDLTIRTYGSWDDSTYRAAFAEDFEVEEVRCLLLDDVLIGYVQVAVEPARLFLVSVVIAPPWQGRGLGAQVLSRLIDEARAAGLPLELSVYEQNAALRLYERLGFVRTGRVAHRVKMRWGSPL